MERTAYSGAYGVQWWVRRSVARAAYCGGYGVEWRVLGTLARTAYSRCVQRTVACTA